MLLLLNTNISNIFSIEENYTYLLPLNKINIIVGKNNSGKSYFMREILKSTIKIVSKDDIKKIIFDKNNFTKLENIKKFKSVNLLTSIQKYINMLEQLEKVIAAKYESGTRVYGGKYSGPVYNFHDFEKLKNDSVELFDYLELLDIDKITMNKCSDLIVYGENELKEKIIDEYINEMERIVSNVPENLMYEFGDFLFDIGYVKIEDSNNYQLYNQQDSEVIPYALKNYIPIMRSIRDPLKEPFNKQLEPSSNIFKTRIINEYKYNENEINVITGLDFYFDYKRKLLGTKKDRSMVMGFEKFLSNYFFEGKPISIIPDEETYELKINIDDKDDKFIFQVGDGITSLIVIMYHIFINCDREYNIYFIEEPEQSFHPGFQRLFMNIISLNEKFKNCYFFFTTHSNHIIDISNHEFKNFTNYLCTKRDNKIQINVQEDEDISAIEELGVKPSSVQIANKIIWVEGKYDAFYMRLLLNKKNSANNKRKYIEDYDYAFVPYGGTTGTLINFSIDNNEDDNEEFITKAKKINHDMLLVMDDDGISSGRSNTAKCRRYNKLKKKMKNRLYKLEVREIENLFPPIVVKKYFINGFTKSNYDFSFLDSMLFEDYKNKKLGDFLNSLVITNFGNDFKKITGRKEGFSKNGFLYDKSKFYDCVLEWVMSDDFNYEDMPQESKNLITVLEEFIKR